MEVKIEKEIQVLKQKKDKMEDEMQNKFPNVHLLKSQIENDKQDMQKMKVILDEVKPGLEKQLTYHSMKHDTLKNQIL